MKKLKIFAEIFGKSLLFLVLAVGALLALSYGADMIREQGIVYKSVALLLIGGILLTMIVLPGLPTSHHNLICKPAERKSNDAEG